MAQEIVQSVDSCWQKRYQRCPVGIERELANQIERPLIDSDGAIGNRGVVGNA